MVARMLCSDIRGTLRGARGVAVMRLNTDDTVAGMDVSQAHTDDIVYVLIVTARGDSKATRMIA